MKFPGSDLVSVFREGEVRRDLQTLLPYAAVLVAIIALCAVLFQVIMVQVEGQSHSWVTAVYWTLVTMTTLGYGDVVFSSDIGRLFTIFVLGAGVVLLLIVLLLRRRYERMLHAFL